MFISWMLIMPSFQKSLIVEQFQGNYLKQEWNDNWENRMIDYEWKDNWKISVCPEWTMCPAGRRTLQRSAPANLQMQL